MAIEREQPQNGPWNPGGTFAHKEADGFLRGFEDIEAAMGEIEKRIELFAKDASSAPWTVVKFAKTYNAIGTPQATRGRFSVAPAAEPFRWPDAKIPPVSRVNRG